MNQKSMLGDNMPRGSRRVLWNALMIVATGVAIFVSVWSLWNRTESWLGSGWIGIAIVAVFVLICVVVHIVRANPQRT